MKNKVIIIVSTAIIIIACIFLIITAFSKEDIVGNQYIPEEDAPNYNTQFVDLYESNIDVDEGSIDLDVSEYSWFEIPNDVMQDYIVIYQYIIYAIDSYFNGDIPGEFTCTLPDDIFNEVTTVIFEVHVKGTEIDLDIAIDMYNKNITVKPITIE